MRQNLGHPSKESQYQYLEDKTVFSSIQILKYLLFTGQSKSMSEHDHILVRCPEIYINILGTNLLVGIICPLDWNRVNVSARTWSVPIFIS